jgi:predicted RecA/RadA family phage recombinase
MKNFVQPGDAMTVPAPADVTAGDGVQVGQLFGVATTDAVNGADVVIQTTGVVDLPKTSAQAWSTIGALVYWTGTEATTTAGTNLPIGCVAATAANPSATGRVRLNGTAVADAS